MRGYVYILSNRSMPGLVKVGKTTTSPSQRMAELHSTGVPTPFELEFAAEVVNCHSCEREAHSLLTKYRVSFKREFFQVSVTEAIKTVLPVLGDYTLVAVKESHGIDKIEADLDKKTRAQEAAARARKSERDRAERELAYAKSKRVAELEGQLANARQRLSALGHRPRYREAGTLENILILCWLPFPYGWMVWLGTLSVFSIDKEWAGMACVFMLVSGFFINKEENEFRAKFSKMIEPFFLIDEEIRKLEVLIRGEGATPSPAPTLQMPVEGTDTVNKVVVLCVECGRKMRLPVNMKLDVTCPHCKKIQRINT